MSRADDVEPAIPIRELPAFPDVAATAQVSEVGVYGASQSEEETVVGAAKREQSLGSVASAVTVLTADTLRRYGYRSLAEALRGVAGIYVVDDRAIERIGVRGLQILGDANTRILILVDGTPLNEPWGSFVDPSTALPVSLDDVARLEVIRGPVSSIYGTNAFFGIINIVTLEADKAPRVYGRTSIDSFGTYGGNAGFNTGTLNRQVRGSFSYSQRTGETLTYPDFNGLKTTADGGQSYFGSLAVNYGRLFFQARAYNRERDLPGAPYDSAIGSDQNMNRDRHELAELGYTRDLSKRITVAGRIYGNHYSYENDLLLKNNVSYRTKALAKWYGGEVRLLADVAPKEKLLSLTTGASFEQTDTTSYATSKPDNIDTNFNIAGAYLEASSEPKKWLGVTLGARFDHNSEFTNETSPRAALFLRKGEAYGLKFLYAAGFRNPSILEAYYSDDLRFTPVLKDMRSELSPERIKAYEVVAYGRPFTGAKLRFSVWNWELSDLLKRFEVFDAMTNEVRVRYQNSAGLISRGAEIESTYRDLVGRAVYFNAAFSFVGKGCQSKTAIWENPLLDKTTGNCDARQNAPVVVAQAGASSQLLLSLFHLSGELAYMSSRGTQDADSVTSPKQTVPAYVGLNLIAYAPNIHGFDVTIGGRNLIMREEVPAQSDYNRNQSVPRVEVLSIPGPGREVFMRMGYKF